MNILQNKPISKILKIELANLHDSVLFQDRSVYEKMPKKDKDSVILVCAAAYTVKCLDHFEHTNIIGNHVSGGRFYKGASSSSYRGGFSVYDGQPHFAYDNWNMDFKEAYNKGGCAFAQDMMTHDGVS